ncbi:MAG: hypothetical protein AAGJ81_05215 [Verrucomicrobiota bacterium]
MTYTTNLLKAFRLYPYCLGWVLFFYASQSASQAQVLTASIGFVTDTTDPTSYTATLPPSTAVGVPASVKLSADGSDSNIDLVINLLDEVEFLPSSDFTFNWSLFELRTEMGSLEVNSQGPLTVSQLVAPNDITVIGNAGILAIGTPNPNRTPGIGSEVTVTVSDDITVSGVGETTPSANSLTLLPSGFRTAQLSGVTAVSYGNQSTDQDSTTGNTVTVTLEDDATITVNQTDSSVITAGISASSATGPGKDNYLDDPDEIHAVTVHQSGDIIVNADAGVGIFANTTGGQYREAGDGEAIGGAVTVHLKNRSTGTDGPSINTNGIGVFALSEVSPVDDDSDIPIAGGDVKVILESETEINVGDSSSTLSIGVLAVSAAANELINPFSTVDDPVDTKGRGSGGSVKVTNHGSITTAGDTSVGIAALSIGGASIVTNSDSDGSENTFLGSNGIHLGAGQEVHVDHKEGASILTIGQGAHGIVALSSGNGGLLNNLGEANRADQKGLTIGNGPSASSDSGSSGGTVSITSGGKITTGDGSSDSQASIGIVAQSIGGGGGSASKKSSLFVGDRGGAGGDGGEIDLTIESSSEITTNDVNSIGILAQSIGGGGGNGGNAEGFFVGVGGKGGDGGAGGQIKFSIDGAINTNEDHSGGLIIQSIGGGGGHGGGATDYTAFLTAGVGIGGTGGKGGDGGIIGSDVDSATIQQDSTITTLGDNSPGATIQSIGGGGGTGGGSSSFDSTAGLGIAIAVGGDGGDGGDGGEAYLTHSGSITTGKEVTTPLFGLTANDGADSIGTILQSIGGGGGHGGSASARALSFLDPLSDDPTAFSVALALGGTGGNDGGGKGSGRTAIFSQDGTTTTWGDGAHGALVQSIGGGGGNGGDSKAFSSALASDALTLTLSISHGGSGGDGGDGGVVDASLENGSSITTHGQNASGLVAQSIGGGGGNGGLGTALSQNINLGGDGTSLDFTIAVGGSGGSGGDGEGIVLRSNSTINTGGVGSKGILAQSIGGGGGNAGGGSVGGGNTEYQVQVAVGGNGGGGGESDEVSVTHRGSITTKESDSAGIIAHSIGGGGGIGGNAAIQQATFKSDTYSSAVSVGGQGGTAGNAESARVESTGSVTTEGDRSYGIVAQSIGGGGGIGGSGAAYSSSNVNKGDSPSVNVAVGGQGGGGGDGGQAGVLLSEATIKTSEATIKTSGYASHGIVAQSVGGGGGIGGDASLDTDSFLNLGFLVSEGVGAGGKGGTVEVYQNDRVKTTGKNSFGVVAQSVGGGGGIATQGSDVELFDFGFDLSPSVNMTFGVNSDMDGNDPSNGGATTVNLNVAAPGNSNLSSNNLTRTEGDWSVGVLAQSIGAGGGKGDNISGTNSNAIPDLTIVLGSPQGHGSGNTVDIVAGTATVTTGSASGGFGAYGILAQSIGAGGGIATDGSSAATGTIKLGASSGGGSGGSRDGGDVSLSAEALTAQTGGTAAHGVILQSVGGGGGVAGTGATKDFSGSLTGVDAPNLTLGGQDTLGDGGSIMMTDGRVTVTTTGDNAFGFIAQSIGGGGGIATAKQGDGEVTLGMTINDGNGDRRSGGTVDLTFINSDSYTSTITTYGMGSHGLVAQSIGAGGGIANPNSASGINPNPVKRTESAHGYGDDVTLNLNGNITTSGSGAYGVIAQVIGGGGGLFNSSDGASFAGSTGGANSSSDGDSNGTLTITVRSDANISTQGSVATAIFAQNVVGNGNSGNSINITVNGSVSSGNGTGIMIHGGTNSTSGDSTNSLTVNSGGEVSSQSDENAVHYLGEDGTETFSISNRGTISGGVLFENSSASSLFTNESIGVFNSGSTLDALMDDSGVFSVGGSSVLQTTVKQIYTQNLGGTLKFDVQSESFFDQLFFEATFGTFDGSVEITLLDNGRDLQVGDQLTLITASAFNSFAGSFISTASFFDVPVGMELDLYASNSGALILDVIAVPEPQHAALFLAVASVPLIAMRRRRRNHYS